MTRRREFFLNKKDAEKKRNEILVPLFYEKYYRGRYRLLAGDDPLQAQDIDTIIESEKTGQKETLEEKIIRWRLDKDTGEPSDQRYTAIAAETWSNINEDRKKTGWMVFGMAKWLLWCFLVPKTEVAMDCYLFDFQALKAWFWEMEQERNWPKVLVYNENGNISEVQVVPIKEIRAAGIMVKKFSLWPEGQPFEHFCEECGRWAPNGQNVNTLNGKYGTWYCAEHNPVSTRGIPA